MIQIVLIILILAFVIANFALAKRKRKQLRKKTATMKTVINCQECSAKVTRPFHRGDFILKKLESPSLHPKFMEYLEKIGDFCNHKSWLITAIYQDDEKYNPEELKLFRRWQLGGQNTW